MSPLLFALFVNDIEDHLLTNGCSYVNIDNEALDNYIIADSEENLQKVITCMETYSGTLKLIVNENKTKVMIFGKTKVKKHLKFIYNDLELELVHNFKYLGLIINFNGSFKLGNY